MSIKDFQIQSQIGNGNSTNIYKVKRIIDNNIYALKKVKLDQLSKDQIHHAINEVRFLASIRHPNIVSYKEAFYDQHSRSLCIVLEYADGGDLLERIFQHKSKGSHFQEDYIWDMFIQLLKGLQAIHQLNISHRDIKSANVFLTRNGLAKLGDFNVSTVLGKGMKCETQAGTPYYASPQVWRDEPYDSKSDIWSLGCVLYEFIHLKPPFRAVDMQGLQKKISLGYFGKVSRYYSNEFSQILKLMLNIDPFARYTCKQLLSHPIIKDKMRKTKEVINLEQSYLMKTIKMVKNMNYLTQKLPKPNYSPVRYRSMREISDGYHIQRRMYKNSSDIIPKVSKSLNMYELNNFSKSSLDKKKRNQEEFDPNILPAIKSKAAKRY